MPSRLPGYPPDTGGRPAYSWHPHPQGGPPPSSPPGAQSKPYYGYPVGPSGSFLGPHPPYNHPEQPPPEDHRGYNDYPGYNEYAKEKSPEAPKDQDHYRRPPNQAGPYPPHPYGPPRVPSTSPPSRTSSYELHDYPRPPEGPPYGPIQHSRSSGSAGSSPKSSPPQKYPVDGRPSHGYREAVPHGYVSVRPPPPPHHGRGPPPYASSSYDSDRPWPLNERGSPPSYPPEADRRGHYEGARDHFGWGGCPPPPPQPLPPPSYASAHPPYPPPPHARRSLAPDCVPPRPNENDSRQASDGSRGARAQSPTQIESSRRDEVANMGCTCKKSKCLKLYCMCFGASAVCGPNCRCLVCYNTPNFETERKEAVRAILSRNPAAFDTKFKKLADQAALAETDRSLSHKLGCKCRKSACTKKYCECFNAGIKCSATCRCMGCQNMPPGGFGPDPRYGYSVPPQSYPGAINVSKYSADEQASAKAGEPWMVGAAQNLAFLKHASPTCSEGRPLGPSDAQAIASMPSLVSSDTTLNSDTDIVATEETQHVAGKAQESGKSDDQLENALLMAAYAMTELKPAAFRNDLPGDILRSSPKRKSTELPNGHGKSFGTEIALKSAGGEDAAPEPFREAPMQRDSSPAATLLTPRVLRKTKRSRLGSVKKPVHAEASLDANDTPDKHLVESDEDPENASPSHTSPSVEGREDEIAVTPASKTSSKDVITPVTARCIDFKRMDVSR